MKRTTSSFYLVPLLLLFSFNLHATSTKPEAYTTIGLGGLSPENKTQIISYVPGLTLLYNLGETPIKVRKQNDVNLRRKYTKATTHNGIELLLLDEGDTLNRNVGNLDKFHFLVTRAIPVCRKADSCVTTDIWRHFDQGRRAGKGWYTVWPRQGGKFLSSPSDIDESFWKVKLLDNVEGWVERYIPAKKGGISTEDLGYLVRMDRHHPLFKFTNSSSETLTTSCSQKTKTIEIDTIEGDFSAYAKVGAEISAEPKSKLSFAQNILKFIGVNTKLKAEVSAEGKVQYSFKDTNITELTYGIDGGSWHFNVVKVERYNEKSSKYDHYATILVKKVFKCEALDAVSMTNANFQIFLGDYGVPVDYKEPLPMLNMSKDTLGKVIGLNGDHEYPSLISLKGQDDYEVIMNYFQFKRGLPKAIAAYLVKEINRSPPLD